MSTKLNLFDAVVLEKDIPNLGLRKGDIGAVVEIYEPDGIEVEFVTGSGKTQALITLHQNEVRAVASEEILSVRTLRAA